MALVIQRGAGGGGGTAEAAAVAYQIPGGAGAAIGFSVAGGTYGYGFVITRKTTIGRIIYNLAVTDVSTTNRYQLGIYDSTGAKVETTATFVINNAATGDKKVALATTKTLEPGKYYFALSALDANVANVASVANVSNVTFLTHQSVAATVMPASFTPPADNWVRDASGSVWFALVP